MCESLWPDTTVDIIPKTWGYEKIIDNNEKYCGKLLHIVAGKKSSVHYHRVKSETFYLESGAIEVYFYADGPKLHAWYNAQNPKPSQPNVHNMMERIILRQGQRLRIPINSAHQIIALEDSQVFEFSSQDFQDDSYRIIKSE